ncbi:MAG: NAD(P)-dependent glycerol-3-phosphate dehydrogenase [Clostridia bacterium]|nr:NAD(P)-dependent glycerol-3-phosphate dehydrogenase [Clostridia bacterium]MDY6184284.1 NAD(P)H-dependent glycerol-3-phosphate dehydrogenase [Eubacteriales bacterium]
MKTICVLGAGTWGIALAEALAGDGHAVTVWSAIPEELVRLEKTHTHPFLPDVKLNESIAYEADIAKAVPGHDLLLFAVPSVYLRSTVEKAKPYIPAGQLIVSVAKGIEEKTLMTMTEVIEDVIGGTIPGVRVVALSGPTHAEEVAAGLPTAIVSACRDLDSAREVQNIFMSLQFRVYVNADAKGVELCGALKNVIALASGISHGMGFGDNTRAAIITRGMAEIARLGQAMGCVPDTFFGLAGIGDLVVTCMSAHSRNNTCGILIGQGVSLDEAIKRVGMVVEGVNTLPAALRLSEKYGVELPIISIVDKVLYHGMSPETAVNTLMGRAKKAE